MDENIIGKNIKHLRMMRGETMDELGSVLHVTKSTVEGYESGRRLPDAKKLEVIAKYYGKTVDEMMHNKIYEIDGVDSTKIVEMKELLNVFLRIFPLIETEKAYENEAFSKGMKEIREMLNLIYNGEEVDGNIISEICECFEDAIEAEVIECVANMIWCIFFLWTQQYADIDKMRKIQHRIVNKQVDWKELIYENQKNNKAVSDQRKRFIVDFDESLFGLISILKETEQWSQLGDYYLALRYVFGIVDTEYSEEMNQLIGLQMLLAFVQIGNKYALDFFKSSSEIQ